MIKLLNTLTGILCLALLITILWVNITEDKYGPVITFANHNIIYTQGSDTNLLLEGVTAIDAKDGDVSDTLMVECIIPLRDKLTAKVYYAAKDQDNHITKASTIVNYIESQSAVSVSPIEDEPTNTSITQTNEPEVKQVLDNSTVVEEEVNQATEETDVTQDNDDSQETEDIQDLEATQDTQVAVNIEVPVLELTVDQVTISKGGEFNPLIYVASITDNKDDAELLYRRVTIKSNYNKNKVGTYELMYNVRDLDMNKSEPVYMKLHVVE
jgi:hypothetical protein